MRLIKLPMININWLSTILILLITASCSGNDRPVYQGAEYYKNLEVPPDLTTPETSGQLNVPKPTEEALQRFRDNNKLETVITPKFDGVRVVNYAGNSWIEVDNNVDKVWPRLLEFWETEGVEVVEARPLLGYMETEWTERLNPDSGYFKSMFQKFQPDQKDKFRVRVEKFDSGNKTRLYIAHARIERVARGEYADEFIWVSRPSNLEAERELIARMSLFAGIKRDASLQLLENYRPYSSLVKIDRANTTALTMTGSMDFVWRRAMRALDRMQMQDISEEKQNSTIRFVVAKVSNETLDVEEDELAKTSWLMQLFTSTDETDIASNTARQYRLEFTDVKGRIQIEVKDARNSQISDPDEGADGDVSGTALAEQLRNLLVKNLE